MTLQKNYSFQSFRSDLLAGAAVAVVALPLGMAFAIASGLPPERGLYTAIVAGFLISLLGGSRFQIGGPTGAFVVVVYSIVSLHGYDGLVMATFMAGGMLLLMGAFKFGDVIKYIPYPVTTGFTAGIALIIASSQVGPFFGLAIESTPPSFIEQWGVYLAAPGISGITALFSICSVVTLVTIRRFAPSIPGPIVVVTLGAFIVWLFDLPLATIQTVFGGIPNTFPTPSFPVVTLERVRELVPEAITIAVLGAIESLMSAVVADGMTGDRHDSNRELKGQGVANLASALCGGIPATGAIARTATNIRAGAHSSVAGMSHSVFLLFFMFVFSGPIAAIPLASLSAVLMVVAWNMSEHHRIRSLLHAPRADILAMFTTFTLTVVVDLTVAIQVGVGLAGLLFIKRMSEVTQVEAVRTMVSSSTKGVDDSDIDEDAIGNKVAPVGVEIYEINGPFFFGVADRLKSTLSAIGARSPVFILRMRHVPMIDATGLRALEDLNDQCRRQGTVLLLSGVSKELYSAFTTYGFIDQVGKERIFPHIDQALGYAAKLTSPPSSE